MMNPSNTDYTFSPNCGVERQQMKIMATQSPCVNMTRPLDYKGDVKMLKNNKVPYGVGLHHATVKYMDGRSCPVNSHQLASANHVSLEPSEGCSGFSAPLNADMQLRGVSFGDYSSEIGTDYESAGHNDGGESYYSMGGAPSSPAMVFDNPVTQRIFNRDMYKRYCRVAFPYST